MNNPITMITQQQIKDRFKNIVFDDPTHKYWYVNEIGEKINLTSTTTLIHKFEHEFDDAISVNVGKKFGLNPKDVLYAWSMYNKYASLSGSIVHNYNEKFYEAIIDGHKPKHHPAFYFSLFENNEIIYNQKEELIKMEAVFPIEIHEILGKISPFGRVEKLQKQFLSFYQKTKDVLIPIGVEMIMADVDDLISGMTDILFWSKKTKQYHLGDYKTNKKFTTDSEIESEITKMFEKYNCPIVMDGMTKDFKSFLKGQISENPKWPKFLADAIDRFFLKEPFGYMKTSKETIYSLQLSNYKMIMQKHFPELAFGNSFLITFSENHEDYKTYPLKDLFPEMQKMRFINKTK